MTSNATARQLIESGMEAMKKIGEEQRKTEEERRKAAAERNTDAAYMREAVEYADQIMAAAIERVNARCGAGTTPELISAFMQAAATIMAANVIARSTEWSGTAVSTSIDNAAMSL